MKSRIIFTISIFVIIIALGFMSVNFCLYSLPDWGVRLVGIIMLADLVVLSHSAVTLKKDSMCE
jgi:hypothetical protein